MARDKKFKGLDPRVILEKTIEVAILPMQTKIASKTLVTILDIIDKENIIVTGDYRNSIVPTNLPSADNLDVSIASVNCPYAKFLEFGTTKMPAKAVFRRAVAQVQGMLS